MHSSILFFVVFMGGLRWGGGGRGIPATPHPLRGSAPRRGAFGAGAIEAPLEGSLRLSKKCIVGASSARP